MRFILNIFIIVLFFVSIAAAQELNREQKLQKIAELNNQIKTLEKDVILPSAKDLREAQKEGFSVFRIMPREIYDGVFTIRGGAAFYSFTNKLHNYNNIPQIQLEGDSLSVGFAGADYGFIADLEEIPLREINKETKGVNFLINYQSPNNEPLARSEFTKSIKGFEIDGVNFKQSISAIVGHNYILRAITYNQADISVAFKVHRKDMDGSLIIFWKLLENFETPKLERNKTVVKTGETTVEAIDNQTATKVQNALTEKGLFNVSVEVTNKEVILRGTVPKGKMAEAVMHATETGKRKVRNELTEQ